MEAFRYAHELFPYTNSGRCASIPPFLSSKESVCAVSIVGVHGVGLHAAVHFGLRGGGSPSESPPPAKKKTDGYISLFLLGTMPQNKNLRESTGLRSHRPRSKVPWGLV